MKKNKNGFTLAETLIVVAILGIIAMITIPNLIKNQVKSQNRVKVKKAMTVYERAINKMTIDNELRSNGALGNYATTQQSAGCEDTFKYFKASQGQGCMFRTSDGVWWDITDIRRPIISFKEENLDKTKANDPDDKSAFVLVGRFQDAISALRVNDKAFEDANSVTEDYDEGTSTSDKMAKLFGFMGISTQKSNPLEDIYFNRFPAYKCTCSGENCCATNCSNQGCTAKVACKSDAKINRSDSVNFVPDSTCVAYQRYKADGTVVNDGNAIMVNEDTVFMRISSMRLYMTKNADGTYTYQFDTPGAGTAINKIVFDSNGEPISFYNYNRGTCTKTNCSWNPNPFDLGTKYGGGWTRDWGGTFNMMSDNDIQALIMEMGLSK